ncbi:Cym1 protein [Martiniozyma asiatica (nom. inval.)]|nr:Cym1 protein [Martiniozyma asiatica]
MSSLKKYSVGAKVAGYAIERVVPVPQFGLTAVELKHTSTGAQHLHVDRQDSNNVFGIVFKTNPPNGTGLPHILEHTTLCGSEKYPVRDPFFKMLNRSLSNFMNAMTGHDYTFYPFATTNRKDFENLMDIYLDATLHPILSLEDFYQEGWRLEHAETRDQSSELKFKGVVYNEMKGQVSDSSYYFWIKFQEAIYPSLNNSGGDPTKITNLVHEDLVEFHSTRYHPSNAKTFTYGDLPLSAHLEKINQAFIPFGKRKAKNIIKEPIKLDSNKYFEISGPLDPMLPSDEQYKSSLTWYAGNPTDIYDSFLLKVVSNLLMDGHSSPLYQKLIESGVGSDFTINTGADSMTAMNLFTIGLSGLTKEKLNNLEKTIIDALKDVQKIGFSDVKVKALIHQLQLSKKVESSQFGLNILSSIVPGWVNNVDPISTIDWDSIVIKFNKEYSEKGDEIFKDILSKYILNKPYFHYVMKPDQSLSEKIQEEENSRLKQKILELEEDDKKAIYERGVRLLEKQEEKEDLSCLPTVNVSDIGREAQFVRINHQLKNNIQYQTRLSSKTNGVSYFRATKSISATELDPKYIKYLPLFSSALTNLGTKDKTMADLEDEIKLYTGGLNTGFSAHSSPDDPTKSFLKMNLSSAALNANYDQMMNLWRQLLIETDFTNLPKLTTLVKSMTSDTLSELVSSGHSYARSAAIGKLSTTGFINDTLNGIKNIQFLKELSQIEANGKLEEEIIPILQHIKNQLLGKESSGFKYALTTSRQNISMEEESIFKFNESLKFKPFDQISYEPNCGLGVEMASLKSFVQIPSQVSFTGSAINGPGYTTKDAASLQVLSQLMTFKYLHSEIREKGGAYGAGASFDALNGILSFYSYRDPKPWESINIFKKAEDMIKKGIESGEIGESELEQAKLSIFQRVDAPKSVREEGLAEFHYGIDEEMKQERREDLLDCELADVLNVSINEKSSDVVIGEEGKEDWQKETL